MAVNGRGEPAFEPSLEDDESSAGSQEASPKGPKEEFDRLCEQALSRYLDPQQHGVSAVVTGNPRNAIRAHCRKALGLEAEDIHKDRIFEQLKYSFLKALAVIFQPDTKRFFEREAEDKGIGARGSKENQEYIKDQLRGCIVAIIKTCRCIATPHGLRTIFDDFVSVQIKTTSPKMAVALQDSILPPPRKKPSRPKAPERQATDIGGLKPAGAPEPAEPPAPRSQTMKDGLFIHSDDAPAPQIPPPPRKPRGATTTATFINRFASQASEVPFNVDHPGTDCELLAQEADNAGFLRPLGKQFREAVAKETDQIRPSLLDLTVDDLHGIPFELQDAFGELFEQMMISNGRNGDADATYSERARHHLMQTKDFAGAMEVLKTPLLPVLEITAGELNTTVDELFAKMVRIYLKVHLAEFGRENLVAALGNYIQEVSNEEKIRELPSDPQPFDQAVSEAAHAFYARLKAGFSSGSSAEDSVQYLYLYLLGDKDISESFYKTVYDIIYAHFSYLKRLPEPGPGAAPTEEGTRYQYVGQQVEDPGTVASVPESVLKVTRSKVLGQPLDFEDEETVVMDAPTSGGSADSQLTPLVDDDEDLPTLVTSGTEAATPSTPAARPPLDTNEHIDSVGTGTIASSLSSNGLLGGSKSSRRRIHKVPQGIFEPPPAPPEDQAEDIGRLPTLPMDAAQTPDAKQPAAQLSVARGPNLGPSHDDTPGTAARKDRTRPGTIRPHEEMEAPQIPPPPKVPSIEPPAPDSKPSETPAPQPVAIEEQSGPVSKPKSRWGSMKKWASRAAIGLATVIGGGALVPSDTGPQQVTAAAPQSNNKSANDTPVGEAAGLPTAASAAPVGTPEAPAVSASAPMVSSATASAAEISPPAPSVSAAPDTPPAPKVAEVKPSTESPLGLRVDMTKVKNEKLRQALTTGTMEIDSQKHALHQIIELAANAGIELTPKQRADLKDLYHRYNVGEYADLMAKYGEEPRWKVAMEMEKKPYLRSFKGKGWSPNVSTEKGTGPYQEVYEAEWKDYQHSRDQLQQVGIGTADNPYAQSPGINTVSLKANGEYLWIFAEIGKIVGYLEAPSKTGMVPLPGRNLQNEHSPHHNPSKPFNPGQQGSQYGFMQSPASDPSRRFGVGKGTSLDPYSAPAGETYAQNDDDIPVYTEVDGKDVRFDPNAPYSVRPDTSDTDAGWGEEPMELTEADFIREPGSSDKVRAAHVQKGAAEFTQRTNEDPANLLRLSHTYRLDGGKTFWQRINDQIESCGQSERVKSAARRVLAKWQDKGIQQLPFGVVKSDSTGITVSIHDRDFLDEMTEATAVADGRYGKLAGKWFRKDGPNDPRGTMTAKRSVVSDERFAHIRAGSEKYKREAAERSAKMVDLGGTILIDPRRPEASDAFVMLENRVKSCGLAPNVERFVLSGIQYYRKQGNRVFMNRTVKEDGTRALHIRPELEQYLNKLVAVKLGKVPSVRERLQAKSEAEAQLAAAEEASLPKLANDDIVELNGVQRVWQIPREKAHDPVGYIEASLLDELTRLAVANTHDAQKVRALVAKKQCVSAICMAMKNGSSWYKKGFVPTRPNGPYVDVRIPTRLVEKLGNALGADWTAPLEGEISTPSSSEQPVRESGVYQVTNGVRTAARRVA